MQVLLAVLLTFVGSAYGDQLTIVALAPFTNYVDNVGAGIKPAIELALEDINREETILPTYNLTVKWIDTQCDMAIATRRLFDLVKEGDASTFVFGDYCSEVTKPLAETIHHFNLWQVSYADNNPSLTDRETYPHFIRAVPSEIDMNNALVSFIQHNGWKRVATIYQDASTGQSTYAFSHNALLSTLRERNLSIVTAESFAGDQSSNLDNIIRKDGRIIVGIFNERYAREIMCKAYYKGMHGHKYVWLLPSSYPANWWMNASNTNCSVSQMREAVDGHFTVNLEELPHDLHQIASINGRSISHYKERYTSKVSQADYNTYHGYAYDGTWLMARVLHDMAMNNSLPATLPNIDLMDMVDQTEFTGVTGKVRYMNGSRLAQLSILQYQKEANALIDTGLFDMPTNEIHINSSLIRWHNNNPPKDEIIREKNILQPNPYIQASLMLLAASGQILAIVFLAINIKYRKRRVIKMSSPNMNNLIIVGCLLVYATIFVMRVDRTLMKRRTYEILCMIHAWMLSIGFTIAFGAMFSKTWRVYNIFNSPHRQKKAIKDYTLALMVVGLTMLDLLILIPWTAVDPLYLVQTDRPEKEENHVMITEVICTCQSNMKMTWMSSFYAYKGLLLVAGGWFAWNTRMVTIPALNDSKYIGLSVYNVVIVCISAVSLSHILRDEPDYVYLIVGLLIIFCTTVTLCLVFVPKIMRLRHKNSWENQRRPRVKLSPKKPSNHSLLAKKSSSKLEVQIQLLEQECRSNTSRLEQLEAAAVKLQSQVSLREIQSQTTDTSTETINYNGKKLPIFELTTGMSEQDETAVTLVNSHSTATTANLQTPPVKNDDEEETANELTTLLNFLDMQESTHI